MNRCYSCGTEWESEKARPGFKECCSDCTAYLHCCKNCHYYDAHAHNNCSIPNTEWVPDPEGGNYCDDFKFADADANARYDDKRKESLNAFDTLFGEGEASTDEKPSTDFDNLFGE